MPGFATLVWQMCINRMWMHMHEHEPRHAGQWWMKRMSLLFERVRYVTRKSTYGFNKKNNKNNNNKNKQVIEIASSKLNEGRLLCMRGGSGRTSPVLFDCTQELEAERASRSSGLSVASPPLGTALELPVLRKHARHEAGSGSDDAGLPGCREVYKHSVPLEPHAAASQR